MSVFPVSFSPCWNSWCFLSKTPHLKLYVLQLILQEYDNSVGGFNHYGHFKLLE